MAGLVPGFGVLETIGRRSGHRHQVPVGGRLEDDAFWLVAGIGHRANYVRNIEADPRVRVKTCGRWRTGTAHLCPDDDASKRAMRINPSNGVFLRIANPAKDALTVRVDLDV
jgi:deazaflavin-dependent oxidoreductase (nitroreductase family)